MTDQPAAHILEFTVPFDVETCQQRLQNRHENMRFWAWDWQRRTWVNTRWRDNHTCQFTLKRIEKNDFIGIGSLGVVRGYLRRLDNGQTAVLAEQHIAWLWIIAPLVFLGFSLGGIVWEAYADPAADPATTPQTAAIWLVIIAVIAFAATVFSWWWAHKQVKFLTGTLKEALGIWE